MALFLTSQSSAMLYKICSQPSPRPLTPLPFAIFSVIPPSWASQYHHLHQCNIVCYTTAKLSPPSSTVCHKHDIHDHDNHRRNTPKIAIVASPSHNHHKALQKHNNPPSLNYLPLHLFHPKNKIKSTKNKKRLLSYKKPKSRVS